MFVIRLVNPGVVDRLIVLDGLPKRYLNGVGTVLPNGLPRHWAKFADKHYVLFYLTQNNDKEKWQEITNFLRRVCDAKIRLLDRIEDMAVPMASDSKEAVSIEPEDIPVIPIPKEFRDVEIAPAEKQLPKTVEKVMKEVVRNSLKMTLKHDEKCKSKGKAGRYAPDGVCKRCDQLKLNKLAVVA